MPFLHCVGVYHASTQSQQAQTDIVSADDVKLLGTCLGALIALAARPETHTSIYRFEDVLLMKHFTLHCWVCSQNASSHKTCLVPRQNFIPHLGKILQLYYDTVPIVSQVYALLAAGIPYLFHSNSGNGRQVMLQLFLNWTASYLCNTTVACL